MSGQATLGRRRLALDVLAQVAGRLVGIVLGIVVTVVIIRSLGDARFGQWSTIVAVTQIASWTADFGLAEVAVARAAAHPEQEAEWLGALVVVRAAWSLVVTAAGVAVILALSTTDDMRLAGLLLLGTVALSGPGAISYVFQVRVRNDVKAGVLLANNIVWTGVVVLVAVSGGGIIPLALGLLGVTLVTTAVETWLGSRQIRISLRGSRRRWRELASAGLATGIAGGLVTIYARADQLLVFQYAGAREAGLYAAVYRILDQGQFLPGTVTTTMMPVIARTLRSQPARAREIVQRTAEYLALVSLPALAFAIVAAEPSVRLLFGDDFVAAAPALPVLMGAFVFISFGYLTSTLLVVLRLQKRMIAIAGAGFVVNIAFNVVLIPRYGFMAAAWVTLITEIVVFAIAVRFVVGELGGRPAVGRVLRGCGAAVAMGALVLGARVLGAPIGVLMALAAASYPLLLLLLRALSVAEIRGVLRKQALT